MAKVVQYCAQVNRGKLELGIGSSITGTHCIRTGIGGRICIEKGAVRQGNCPFLRKHRYTQCSRKSFKAFWAAVLKSEVNLTGLRFYLSQYRLVVTRLFDRECWLVAVSRDLQNQALNNQWADPLKARSALQS